ncbi:MAG: hypothetical protein U5K69_09210 [Balneolaceae bacterium]|nr:hypothetical protein [Balneolaceae bacterium]
MIARDQRACTDIGKGLWMYEGGLRNFSASWSSDSRWVAFSRGLENRQGAIFLYNTDSGETTQVTSGYYHDRVPGFRSRRQSICIFSTSRTMNPQYSDMDNTWIYANSTNVVAVPLTEEIDSPLAPRNDEVEIKSEEEHGKETEENTDEAENEQNQVEIDLEGFESRLIQLPMDAGNYGNLSALSGKVLFQRYPRTGADGEGSTLAYYDFEEREEKSYYRTDLRISAFGRWQ